MTQSPPPPAMQTTQHGASNWLSRRMLADIGKMLVVALAITIPAAAHAHSFSLAVVAGGEQAAMQLNSAVKGILLATQERDGHADETSDGYDRCEPDRGHQEICNTVSISLWDDTR